MAKDASDTVGDDWDNFQDAGPSSEEEVYDLSVMDGGLRPKGVTISYIDTIAALWANAVDVKLG